MPRFVRWPGWLANAQNEQYCITVLGFGQPNRKVVETEILLFDKYNTSVLFQQKFRIQIIIVYKFIYIFDIHTNKCLIQSEVYIIQIIANRKLICITRMLLKIRRSM